MSATFVQNEFDRLLEVLHEAVQQGCKRLEALDDTKAFMLRGMLNGLENPSTPGLPMAPVDVLRLLVNVCLPVGHPAKTIKSLTVHGPERLGKSMVGVFPLIMMGMPEFKALAQYGLEDKVDFFNGNLAGGPYVRNEINSFCNYFSVLERAFKTDAALDTKPKPGQAMYKGNYVFGYNGKHYERLLEVCTTNSKNQFFKFSAVNVIDEADMPFGQKKGGVAEKSLRAAMELPCVAGGIFITATDLLLHAGGQHAVRSLEASQTVKMLIPRDYIGLDNVRDKSVQVVEFPSLKRPKHKPGNLEKDPMDAFVHQVIDKFNAEPHVLGDGDLKLVGSVLVMTDLTIQRNVYLAQTSSARYNALCVAVCDTGRFNFFWRGAELNVKFAANDTFPDAVKMAFAMPDLAGDVLPPVFAFAGQVAKRGFTFQFTIKRANTVFRSYVKRIIFDYARDAKQRISRPIESFKQQVMRFAGRLFEHDTVVMDKKALGIKIFLPSDLTFADILAVEDTLEHIRRGQTGAQFSGTVVLIKSHKRKSVKSVLVSAGAVKRMRSV